MPGGAVRILALLAFVLEAACLGCSEGDVASDRNCPAGQVCGFHDHKYFSTYYCGGTGVGYSWRDRAHCGQQCEVAAAWGCDITSCDCSTDHGTATWLPCTEANGGQERPGGCFLPGSGTNGETVSCACN